MLAGTFDPGADGTDVLGVLAWCASAAGVGGVIVTGTLMALQLRHGEMGADTAHLRSMFYILVGCVVSATAGPLVEALGPLGL
ncbi:hypothetical protein DMH25_31765 [Streptomyces sp. WAC 01325]|uniref:hypothetical protein n=1 Tax=Streptomyces sp. WAC 01325 TaxID=2203202 RepID=UPI000F899310|nr:hypothetical protein [Streptomyces sp. WAC 01325]RSM96375.1 hypothetical protein DMH25_31765 [Streptomyces sp. WAC 01325]